MSKENANNVEVPGYRIVRPLGRGGMASVYLAIQESVEREVALKVMSPVLLVDPSFSERFLREARIAANLHHRHIVAVHDVGAHGDYHYIAMEYLAAGAFGRKGNACEPDVALRIVKEIASALDYAHSKGYIHRDVKPDNVLFREDGSAVLTDFGIARATDSATQMTRTGSVIGTPHYMSPEQSRGNQVDRRADLYSLGIVFYELLRGRVPFEGEDSLSVGIKHITEPVPVLPPALNQYQSLIERLLAKSPDDRYQTGEEVVEAIAALQTNPDVSVVPPSPDVPISRAQSTLLIDTGQRRKAEPNLGDLAGVAEGGLGNVRSRHSSAPKASGSRAWIVWLLLLVGAGATAWFQQDWIRAQLVAYDLIPGEETSVTEQVAGTETQTPVVEEEPELPAEVPLIEPEVPQLTAEQHLATAEAAMLDGRLLPPDENNAYDHFKAALQQKPDQPLASHGLEQIANELVNAAEVALLVGQLPQARQLIERLQRYFPEDERISELAARQLAADLGADTDSSP
ncbi:MAG: hypothetical protein DHS20C11_24580 [Lysobacteraceae bacterium]|nr:MAG: hypothetical protein DHS20C11_24580 [Xanthomonadaceae bacterium]